MIDRCLIDSNAGPGASGLNSLGLSGAPKETRVVVAMSGGVDSSVAAALLAEEGYEVIGITLQLYDHGVAASRKGACCAGQDIHDARRAADEIGIPHYVLDYESRFRNAVMEEFADSYVAGETPVPCIRCNERIKFRDMLHAAKELGAQALATGHYISSKPGPEGWEMHRAADPERDQSYFLFTTTQKQLCYLRFPLGRLHKDETRAIAARLGLDVADKPDSQDICFVPSGRYTDVILKMRPDAAEPGDIVDIEGNVLGRHDGIINYTIGQRRGLGVAAGDPLYVLRLDVGDKRVVVGPRKALLTEKVVLRDINWIGNGTLEDAPEEGVAVLAKVRSTRPPKPARLRLLPDGAAEVTLLDGEDGVAPGQACVFYDVECGGSRVLGGGWIRRTANCFGTQVSPARVSRHSTA